MFDSLRRTLLDIQIQSNRILAMCLGSAPLISLENVFPHNRLLGRVPPKSLENVFPPNLLIPPQHIGSNSAGSASHVDIFF